MTWARHNINYPRTRPSELHRVRGALIEGGMLPGRGVAHDRLLPAPMTTNYTGRRVREIETGMLGTVTNWWTDERVWLEIRWDDGAAVLGEEVELVDDTVAVAEEPMTDDEWTAYCAALDIDPDCR